MPDDSSPNAGGQNRSKSKSKSRDRASSFENVSPTFYFDPSNEESTRGAKAQQLASDLFADSGLDFGENQARFDDLHSATRKAAGLETSLFDRIAGIDSTFAINPATGMLDVARSKNISPLGIAGSLLGGGPGMLVAKAVQGLGAEDPFAFDIPLGFAGAEGAEGAPQKASGESNKTNKSNKSSNPDNNKDGFEFENAANFSNSNNPITQLMSEDADADLPALVKELLTAQAFDFSGMPQFNILDSAFGGQPLEAVFAAMQNKKGDKSDVTS